MASLSWLAPPPLVGPPRSREGDSEPVLRWLCVLLPPLLLLPPPWWLKLMLPLGPSMGDVALPRTLLPLPPPAPLPPQPLTNRWR